MKNAHVSTTGYDCINETDYQRRSPSKFISCTAQIDLAVRAFQLLAFVHISCKRTVFRWNWMPQSRFPRRRRTVARKDSFLSRKDRRPSPPKKAPLPMERWTKPRNQWQPYGATENHHNQHRGNRSKSTISNADLRLWFALVLWRLTMFDEKEAHSLSGYRQLYKKKRSPEAHFLFENRYFSTKNGDSQSQSLYWNRQISPKTAILRLIHSFVNPSRKSKNISKGEATRRR